MTALKKYISGLPYPVFLLNSLSEKIFYSNGSAISELQIEDGSDLKLADHIKFLTDSSGVKYAQLNHKWYRANIREFELPGEQFNLLELTQIEGIPDNDSIESWKNMIAVMLHRLRSPLTGINGYLDMLEDEIDDKKFSKRFESMHKGFNNIYDLMDELEIFYNLSPKYNESEFTDVKLSSLLDDVLFSFGSEQQQRIKADQSFDSSILKYSNPNALKQILIALLTNALEHSTDKNIDISYSPEHGGSISVKNDFEALDPAIKDQIFYPFVTTKATNLGIGLSVALVRALQIGGIIFLSEEGNSLKFTFQFPLS